MGLQYMMLLGKLHLISTSSTHTTMINPLVANLVWPYLLKLSFSSTLIRRAYLDAARSLRLFVFQMGQIAFGAELGRLAMPDSSERWRRALRLVYDRFAIAVRRAPGALLESEEESLHTHSP